MNQSSEKLKYASVSQGLGITGLVLGIVTLLVSFIPCFGTFAVFFGILAILISVIGLVIALVHKHPKGLIIGALLMSLLGCAIGYSQYAAMNAVTNAGVEGLETFIEENSIKKEDIIEDVQSGSKNQIKENINKQVKTSGGTYENSNVVEDNIPEIEEESGGYGTILVENLRLREKPSLDGETITLLKKDSFVNVDELTEFKTTIELNGKEISDVWYKIYTEEGKVGWVHGCCIDVTFP